MTFESQEEIADAKKRTKRTLTLLYTIRRGLAQGAIRSKPFIDMSNDNVESYPIVDLSDMVADEIKNLEAEL